ncbi:MAG: hypothetical protein ACRD3E_13590 [Terriglobales bacterium]
MACEELDQLRQQATALKERVDEQRRKARGKALDPRSGRVSGKSEMIPFLQRKLQRIAEKIEIHMNLHGCQD